MLLSYFLDILSNGTLCVPGDAKFKGNRVFLSGTSSRYISTTSKLAILSESLKGFKPPDATSGGIFVV